MNSYYRLFERKLFAVASLPGSKAKNYSSFCTLEEFPGYTSVELESLEFDKSLKFTTFASFDDTKELGGSSGIAE